MAWFVRTMLVLLLWAVPTWAAQPLPPGLEHDVMHLVEGPEQLGPAKLVSIRITDFVVQFGLEAGSSKGLVELLPVDSNGAGEKLGTTKSFSVWLAEGDSADLKQSAKLLLDRIASHDDGSFYEKAAALRAGRGYEQHSGRNAPPGAVLLEARSLGTPDMIRRAVTWGALLLLLAWTLLASFPRTKADFGWWVFLIGLGGVATLLRFVLPPWAPIHANMHGIAELRGLVTPEALWRGPVETARYGYAYRQVVRAVIGLWNGQVRSALGFAAVAGGLSAAALAVLAARLFKSRWAGAVAGLALAAHPAHVALSKSESPMALAGLLFLIALACAASTRRSSIWASALALACAAELSLPTLFLAAAGVAAIVLWRPSKTVPSLKAFAWPGLVLLLTVGLHTYSLWPVLKAGVSERGAEASSSTVLRVMTQPDGKNLALDASLTARTLLPLAALGLLVLLARRRFGVSLSALLAIALPLIPAVAVMACRTDLIRYQTVAHFGLFLLAAGIVLAMPDRTWPRAAMAGVVALVLIVPVVPGLKDLRKPSIDASAFELADEALGKLPDKAIVRIAPRRSGKVISDFPEFLAQRTHHNVFIDADGSLRGTCHVWLGPACYSFSDEEVRDGLPDKLDQVAKSPVRPECKHLLEQIDWEAEPILAATVPVPWGRQEFFHIPGKRPLIGMFPCSHGPRPADGATAPQAQQGH